MDKKFEHEMHSIGLHERLLGGEDRLNVNACYFNAKVIAPVVEESIEEAQAEAGTPVVSATPGEKPAVVPDTAEGTEVAEADGVDEEEAILEALYEGPVLTEELLEYLESTDWDEANEEELDAVVESLLDKDVPEDLEERIRAFLSLIQEKKAFRIVKGKKKRVNVKVGGEKTRAHREYLKAMRKGGKRAKVRRAQKKRKRKASAKIASRRTARYHEKHPGMKGTFTNKATAIVKKAASKLANVAKKVKAKAGMAPKAESELMTSLRNLLTEDVAMAPTERDAIMVTMGNVAESLEVIFEYLDPSVSDFMGEQYVALAEEYLEGALHEGAMEDGDFVKRVGDYAKLVGKCIQELEKKFEDRA